MEEIWKSIPGHSRYEASNLGKVRYVGTNILVHLIEKSDGYMGVKIDGLSFNLSRLILMAFAGLPTEGMEASHIDGDRNNNAIDNLVWESHFDNMARKRKFRYSNEIFIALENQKSDTWMTINIESDFERDVSEELVLMRQVIRRWALDGRNYFRFRIKTRTKMTSSTEAIIYIHKKALS